MTVEELFDMVVSVNPDMIVYIEHQELGTYPLFQSQIRISSELTPDGNKDIKIIFG